MSQAIILIVDDHPQNLVVHDIGKLMAAQRGRHFVALHD